MYESFPYSKIILFLHHLRSDPIWRASFRHILCCYIRWNSLLSLCLVFILLSQILLYFCFFSNDARILVLRLFLIHADEIMQHELTITYRVLGYLLLGVVRIYSKKVEYLYRDCNEVLTHINTSVPSKLQHKEGMCAPYSSITLPERFELDGFVLELPEDMSR